MAHADFLLQNHPQSVNSKVKSKVVQNKIVNLTEPSGNWLLA